jgi:hypothetical protein
MRFRRAILPLAACAGLGFLASAALAGATRKPESGQAGAVNVAKAVGAGAMTPCWTAEWTVFGPIPKGADALPGDRLKAVPRRIEIGGIVLQPRAMKAEDGTLDLKSLWPDPRGGKDKEGLAACAFAEIECPTDGTLYVNCGADWWMAWYLDGRAVYSTLDEGNLIVPDLIEKRGFSAAVTKGRHVLAALVRSGSGGWALRSAGGLTTAAPADLQAYFEPWKTVLIPEKSATAMERVEAIEPAPPVTRTEAQRIIEKAGAPRRFADYRPRFRVEEEDSLIERSSSRQVFSRDKMYVIHDGDRPIGSMKQWFGGVDISLTDMNPLEPWNGPDTPSGKGREAQRYCRLLMGVPFQIEGVPHEARWTYAVSADSREMHACLSHTPTGDAKDAWRVRRMRATLRVDPHTGYVVVGVQEFASAAVPRFLWAERKDSRGKTIGGTAEGYEYCNVLPSHVINFTTYGPFLWRYERTMYTPRSSDKYLAWLSDTPQASASDEKGLLMRKDGFVAFLSDREGWSQVLSHNSDDPVDFQNATCWKLQDQHNNCSIPRPAGDGPYRMGLRCRFLNLPPEATRYLLDRTEMMLGVFVMVRQGQERDFESDARRPETSSPWHESIEITAEAARSGRKAAVLRGDPAGKKPGKPKEVRVRLDPLPVVEAGRTYILTAWVKVTGEGARAWLSAEPSWWNCPEHEPLALERLDSGAAGAAEGWQRLALEFTTPPQHGRSPVLYLKAHLPAGGSAVYVDDLEFVEAAQQNPRAKE